MQVDGGAASAETTALAGVAATDALWQLADFSGPPSAFWPSYMETVATLVAAHRALLLVRQEGTWTAFRQWPAGESISDIDPQRLRRLAEAAAVHRTSSENGGAGQGPALAASLPDLAAQTEGPIEATVLVLLLPEAAAPATTRELRWLAATAGLPARYESRYRSGVLAESSREHGDDDAATLFEVVQMAVNLGEERHFLRGCLTVCNETAQRLGCARVSLGWLAGTYVRLKAISHIEKFDRHMAAGQQLEAAMEEAVDQDSTVMVPAGADTAPVVRAHQTYARNQGVTALLSVPLRHRDRVVGVLTAERATPFNHDEIWAANLIADVVAGQLADLAARDRWIGARIAGQVRGGLSWLLGAQQTWLKAGVALAALTLLALSVVEWPWRIDSNFTLESNEVAVVPAPFEGFLKDTHVRVGERVEKGQLLAELAARELLLNETKALADVQRYAGEIQQARAEGNLAAMRVAEARKRQAEARLERIRHDLERATIEAPMAGVVVEGDLDETLGSPVQKGDQLLRLARIDQTRVEIEIDQQHIHAVTAGATGELAFAGRPGKHYPFKIERIDPAATTGDGETRFKARARITGERADWWRPGMGGTAKIQVGERPILWLLTRRTVRFLQEFFWI